MFTRVERDPLLPHQIVLATSRGGTDIIVSCNCLRTTKNSKARNVHHEPIATVTTVPEAWKYYNDSSNHDSSSKTPFTDEWKGGSRALSQEAAVDRKAAGAVLARIYPQTRRSEVRGPEVPGKVLQLP